MTEQLKGENAACPKCGNKPAEYKQKAGPLRWFCAHCGASGPVQVFVPAAQLSAAGKKVHKHWSGR